MHDFETITYALFGAGDLDSAIATAHQRNLRRKEILGCSHEPNHTLPTTSEHHNAQANVQRIGPGAAG